MMLPVRRSTVAALILAIGIAAPCLARDSKESNLADAALLGDAARVTALIEAGANPDSRDKQGHPAIYLAAVGGHEEVVRVLLRAGAKVDAPAKNDSTALVIAATTGHADVVAALIEGGADVLAAPNGIGPLEMAVREKHPEVVRVLEPAMMAERRRRGEQDRIADLSTVTFASMGKATAPRGLVVRVDDAAVSRRYYSSGGGSYSVPYWLGDAERAYAGAVAAALGARLAPAGEPPGGGAELRLVAFSHVLLVQGTGTLPNVADEVTAKWKLTDASGTETASLVFLGREAADTHAGLWKKQVAVARARAFLAFGDLYEKSVAGILARLPEER